MVDEAADVIIQAQIAIYISWSRFGTVLYLRVKRVSVLGGKGAGERVEVAREGLIWCFRIGKTRV